MKRRFLSTILALSLILGLCSPAGGLLPTAEAADRTSGSLSPMGADYIRWVRDETLTLTLSGTGALPDEPTKAGLCPFHSFDDAKDSIYNLTAVVVEEGITHIGKAFFQDAWSCTFFSLPQTLTSIGDYAFDGTRELQNISLGSTSAIGAYAFQGSGLTEISLPSTLSYVGPYAFSGCSELTDVYYEGTRAQWAQIQIETGNSSLTNANIIYMAEEMGPDEEDPLVIPTPVLQTIENKTAGIAITWNTDLYLPGVDVSPLGYHILRKTAGGSYQKIATLTDLSTGSYTDTNVEMLKEYTYTVRIFAGDQVGSYDSKGLTITRLGAVAEPTYPNQDFGWSIVNAAASFGYPSNYKYDVEQIFHALGITPSQIVMSAYTRFKDWGGNCFGMSFLASAYYNGQLSLEPYFSSASGPLSEFGYDILRPASAGSSSQVAAITNRSLIDLVERAHFAQYSSKVKDSQVFKNQTNYSGLMDFVENDNSRPLVIALTGKSNGESSAHTVATYPAIDLAYYSETHQGYCIPVYDPNYPQTDSDVIWSEIANGTMYSRYSSEYYPCLWVFPATGNWELATEDYHITGGSSDIRIYDLAKIPDSFFTSDSVGSLGAPKRALLFSIPGETDEIDGSITVISQNSGRTIMEIGNQVKQADPAYVSDYLWVEGTGSTRQLMVWLTDACDTITLDGNQTFDVIHVADDMMFTVSAKDAKVTFSPKEKSVTYGADSKGDVEVLVYENARMDSSGEPQAVKVETTLAGGKTVKVAIDSSGTPAISGPANQTYNVATEKDGKYTEKNNVTEDGLSAPTVGGFPFTDVTTRDWYYAAVKYVYENSLMSGTSATTFTPNGTMSRAMLATVLYRMEGEPKVSYSMTIHFGEGPGPYPDPYIGDFTDVKPDMWYSDAIMWANQKGIVSGYDEDTFGTNDPVTREQLVTMLYRYAKTKTNSFIYQGYGNYRDAGQVSSWAREAMMWAMGHDVISGTSSTTLSPQATATRAQCATILMRYCQD